jgi:hypothetical protein
VLIALAAIFASVIAPQNPYDLAQLDIMDGRLPPGTAGDAGYIPARLENPALLSDIGMAAPSDRVAVRTALGSVPAARPGALPQRDRRRFVGLLTAPAG